MRISNYQVLALVNHRLNASLKLVAQGDGPGVDLRAADRDRLVHWVRASTTPQRVVTRSVIVLMAASGWSNARIAAELGISRRTVALWKARFAGGGPDALLVDAPGRGRKPGRDAQLVARIVELSLQPRSDGRRWTVRSMAEAVGASHSTVQRVWREQAIHPAPRPAAIPARA